LRHEVVDFVAEQSQSGEPVSQRIASHSQACLATSNVDAVLSGHR
jgi:hypothetical protein